MSFTRQQAPLGLGHAVWCARDIVCAEPFAVVLPDELVLNTPGCLKQMMQAAENLGPKSNIVAVEAVPDDMTHNYGICGVGKRSGNTFEIEGMVENHRRAQPPLTFPLPGATFSSPRSSKFSEARNAAPAAKSSSPTP